MPGINSPKGEAPINDDDDDDDDDDDGGGGGGGGSDGGSKWCYPWPPKDSYH